jgi:hypothetical protein
MIQSMVDTRFSAKEGDQCYLDALHGAFQLALAVGTAGLVSASFLATYDKSGWEEEAREMGECE